jgi:DNA-binding transcriptional MocR family regulator
VPLPRTKVFTTSDSANPPRALTRQINELRRQPYQKSVKNRRVEVRIAKVGLEQAFGERLIVDLPPGGIQFAVQFAESPDGPLDDVAVASRAREAGLAVLPLSIWYANGAARRTLRGLVMGFANIADAGEAGRLARTLRACLDG